MRKKYTLKRGGGGDDADFMQADAPSAPASSAPTTRRSFGLVAPLAIILTVGVLCLQLQHAVMYNHSTLQDRLKQVPEQVEGVVRVMTREAASQRVHRMVAVQPAKNESEVPARASASVATSAAAAARPPAEMVGALYSTCAHRKPYHVVLTAASGIYQEWQTRIAYYHYKKLRAANPCSDIGGFTRLLNTPGAQPAGLMDEIPTVSFSHGRLCFKLSKETR